MGGCNRGDDADASDETRTAQRKRGDDAEAYDQTRSSSRAVLQDLGVLLVRRVLRIWCR
jgi:hypothetical protein